MPRRQSQRRVQCRHFSWLLRRRGRMWIADGRGSTVPLGRHSLGTHDYQTALKLLEKLDAKLAAQNGLAAVESAKQVPVDDLELEQGKQSYLAYAGRPRVAGGVRESSLKRYRTVMEKFCKFATERGLKTWNQVTSRVLEAYAAYLEVEGYAYRSKYLELSTVKQAIVWFRNEEMLPETAKVKLRLRKPEGTSTRCWTQEQIGIVLEYCDQHPQLKWIGDIVLLMALTGLRISEVRDLRWSDLDLPNKVLYLGDETARQSIGDDVKRTLKGGRGRGFPIHEKLLPMLESKKTSSGPVFSGPLGGRLKPDLVRRKLIQDILGPIAKGTEDAQAAAALLELRPHGLRHFFCSLCCSRNVPLQMVMEWLGHRESEMVRHYYHMHNREAMRQMQRLDVEFPLNGAGT